MSDYHLYWVDKNLAAGHAPMSYDDLAYLRQEGVTAIVNLCGEYCDLHEIEAQGGFKVRYLPIPDEHAPDTDALAAAVAWVRERLAEGDKVLVHCRFGMGRTGTFLTAWFMHQGHGYGQACRLAKAGHCEATSYSQWRFLRKLARSLADQD